MELTVKKVKGILIESHHEWIHEQAIKFIRNKRIFIKRYNIFLLAKRSRSIILVHCSFFMLDPFTHLINKDHLYDIQSSHLPLVYVLLFVKSDKIGSSNGIEGNYASCCKQLPWIESLLVRQYSIFFYSNKKCFCELKLINKTYDLYYINYYIPRLHVLLFWNEVQKNE